MQLFFYILTIINSLSILFILISKLLFYKKMSNIKGFNISNIDLDMWSDIGVIKNEKKI